MINTKLEVTDLRALHRNLVDAGQKRLWLDLRKQFRTAMKPLTSEIQESARSTLPRRGGLNEWVAASKITASIYTGQRRAGVDLKVSKKGSKRKHDIADLDKGLIRHPVHGNRKKWAYQSVPRGFASTPVRASRPRVAKQLVAAMQSTARSAGFK